MREQGVAAGDIDQTGIIEVKRMRKKSCLSPIVEQKVGRDESPDARRQAESKIALYLHISFYFINDTFDTS